MISEKEGEVIRDTRLGALGHAGVRHLRFGTREQYKSLRVQLAENAEVRRLSDDLLQEGAVEAG
jgi:hypothetical protein